MKRDVQTLLLEGTIQTHAMIAQLGAELIAAMPTSASLPGLLSRLWLRPNSFLARSLQVLQQVLNLSHQASKMLQVLLF